MVRSHPFPFRPSYHLTPSVPHELIWAATFGVGGRRAFFCPMSQTTIFRNPLIRYVYLMGETEDGRPILLDQSGLPLPQSMVLQVVESLKIYRDLTHEQLEEIKRETLEGQKENFKKIPPILTKSSPNTDSWVYVMINKRNGLRKIGVSAAPRFREKTLQSEEPEIEIESTFVGGLKEEEKLHKHFKKQRVRGEWFNLAQSDVEKISTLMARSAVK